MVNWNEIKCYQCGHCNRKGKPSVTKGSAYCEANSGIMSEERKSIWQRIKGFSLKG